MTGPAADALPWPNVRGKRCLVISPTIDVFEAEVKGRGAADVVTVDTVALTAGPGVLDADRLGEFDVVVSHDLVVELSDPLPTLIAVAQITRGMLVSCEPIDLWLSVFARGRPLISPRGTGADVRYQINGAGQKQLLAAAGFVVERTGKPFVVPPHGPTARPSGGAAILRRVLLRGLTGSFDEGTLCRGLLARRVAGRDLTG